MVPALRRRVAARPAYHPRQLPGRLVSIARAHQLAGHPSPAADEWVRTVLKGIRRKRSAAQRRVAPIGVTVLRQALAALPDTLLGARDRALLLLGFCGALRRSELVALDIADLQFVPDGLIVTLRRSKTDQEGEGQLEGIPLGGNAATCPVRAVQAWIKAAGVKAGPLFRPIDRHGKVRAKRLNGSDIAVIVKRSVAAAGFDPDMFSGHSLRAGLATAAAGMGAPTYNIRKQTGHKSDRMLEVYIRKGSLEGLYIQDAIVIHALFDEFLAIWHDPETITQRDKVDQWLEEQCARLLDPDSHVGEVKMVG